MRKIAFIPASALFLGLGLMPIATPSLHYIHAEDNDWVSGDSGFVTHNAPKADKDDDWFADDDDKKTADDRISDDDKKPVAKKPAAAQESKPVSAMPAPVKRSNCDMPGNHNCLPHAKPAAKHVAGMHDATRHPHHGAQHLNHAHHNVNGNTL